MNIAQGGWLSLPKPKFSIDDLMEPLYSMTSPAENKLKELERKVAEQIREMEATDLSTFERSKLQYRPTSSTPPIIFIGTTMADLRAGKSSEARIYEIERENNYNRAMDRIENKAVTAWNNKVKAELQRRDRLDSEAYVTAGEWVRFDSDRADAEFGKW